MVAKFPSYLLGNEGSLFNTLIALRGKKQVNRLMKKHNFCAFVSLIACSLIMNTRTRNSGALELI